MFRHSSFESSFILRGLAAAALCATCLTPCGADDAAAVRGRNLLPQLPPPPKTRAELFREWDLNCDGKIDRGEAEVAASRMRLERAELRLNSGIDPVTGLPRDAAPDQWEPDPLADQARPQDEPPDATVAEPDHEESPRLPGMRVPGAQLPAGASDRPAAAGGRHGFGAARQPVTGGVRAGGIPARSGYGSDVPARALNAGLPIPPRSRPADASGPRPRGGLVPVPRQTPTPMRPTSPPPRTARPQGPYDPY